jgi:RNA polymerase sigma factor (sigma-70 family)
MSSDPETLLRSFQAGDGRALDDLCAFYLPRLKRWARAHLRSSCRDGWSTEDLVQEAFVRSLPSLRTFTPRGPSGIFHYLCAVVRNQARDHLRKTARRPRREQSEPDTHAHPGPSPLQQVMTGEVRARYERALAVLPEQSRQMVVASLELRYTDDELAARFARPSRDAARMARKRAVATLAQAMTATA